MNRTIPAALTALLLCAPPASAQIDLALIPKIGVFTPAGSLTEDTELSTGLALGLAAEFELPILPIRLRAGIEHLATTELERRNRDETKVGDVSLTMITGDLVLRPLPATSLFRPYFLAGAGVKQYDMTLENLAGGELSGIEQKQTRFTGHVGGGLDIALGPLSAVLEVSDYLSTFRAADGTARLQNDLFGMAGFRVRLF